MILDAELILYDNNEPLHRADTIAHLFKDKYKDATLKAKVFDIMNCMGYCGVHPSRSRVRRVAGRSSARVVPRPAGASCRSKRQLLHYLSRRLKDAAGDTPWLDSDHPRRSSCNKTISGNPRARFPAATSPGSLRHVFSRRHVTSPLRWIRHTPQAGIGHVPRHGRTRT